MFDFSPCIPVQWRLGAYFKTMKGCYSIEKSACGVREQAELRLGAAEFWSRRQLSDTAELGSWLVARNKIGTAANRCRGGSPPDPI